MHSTDGFPLLVVIIPIHSIVRDTKSTVFHYFVCTVMDFSAGALPIGMKLCTASQTGFLPFCGDSPRDG